MQNPDSQGILLPMKKHKHLLYLVVLSLGITHAVTAHAEQALKPVGKAYDRSSGKLLYIEHRAAGSTLDSSEPQKIEYRDAGGKLLASKTLSFPQAYAPDYELLDARSGYLEGGQHVEDGFYRLYHRADADASMKENQVEFSYTLVSDAGLPRFLRARMEYLLKKGKVSFDLAAAQRTETYKFEASRLDDKDLAGRAAICIQVQPASMLRMVVAPLIFSFDKENLQLLRYEGLSNIRDEAGKQFDVRIDYPVR